MAATVGLRYLARGTRNNMGEEMKTGQILDEELGTGLINPAIGVGHLLDQNTRLRIALRGIVALIGNVDHSVGNGANSAKMRGEMLNSLREIAAEALKGVEL